MTRTTLLTRQRAAAAVPRDYRKELWTQVCIAVARAEAAKDPCAPGRWADRALEAFDKTFKEPTT